jgi:hypothetical protein
MVAFLEMMGIMEELEAGAEIPTPANIFYPCKTCIFNEGEIFLSPDIDPDEVWDIGTLAGREGLKRRLQELFDEIEAVQRELDFIDRQGFSE